MRVATAMLALALVVGGARSVTPGSNGRHAARRAFPSLVTAVTVMPFPSGIAVAKSSSISRVSGRTFCSLLSTRETVTRATPAASATSSIVKLRLLTRAR